MKTESNPVAGEPIQPGAAPRAAGTLSDPERWVELYGDYLFKYAGRSAEKSWLVGILKNKICDHFRKASRETLFTDMEFYSDEEGDRFVPDGRWTHELGPQEWASPGASLDSDVFWKTFHDCSSKLPKNVSAVFSLREVDGLESKEICALLNISENNLWVMLHRARMALRRCLETNWFVKQNVSG